MPLSQGKAATASSSEGAGLAASMAFDGHTPKRWAGAFADPQWIQVDLGASVRIGRVVLRWESAYGRAYRILTSGDRTNRTPAHTTTAGDGGFDDRYVRLEPTLRGTADGYSLWEFGVHGWTGTASAGSGLPIREEARDGAGFILVWKRSTSW